MLEVISIIIFIKVIRFCKVYFIYNTGVIILLYRIILRYDFFESILKSLVLNFSLKILLKGFFFWDSYIIKVYRVLYF